MASGFLGRALVAGGRDGLMRLVVGVVVRVHAQGGVAAVDLGVRPGVGGHDAGLHGTVILRIAWVMPRALGLL